MMKKNGMNGKNRWIRTTALAVAAVLAFSGTANTFAQAMDTDAIAGAYRAALPVVSVAAVDRSMKLAEKALEEMKAAAKTEKTENTQKKEETKNQSSESSKTTSSVKKENTGKTEKTESQVSSSAKKPASSSSSSTKKPASSSSSSSKKPASSAPSASSKPSNGGTTTLKNNGCEIDTSKAAAGTIRVRQNGNPTKVKVLVYFNGSSKYYQYTIPTNNTWTSIPLQSGSGTYKVRFMKQVSGNSYSQMYSVTFQVGMQNANSAYLNPSQYVVYNSGSACVAKAKSLVSGAGSDAQKVSKIYSYIVNNISYDYDKMKNLPSGYLPNPDSTLASRKGICFDYAALMAAMLRSQGVPCKLVIGNADGQYHAWNMVYVNGSWQLYDPTFGAAGQRAGSYVAERVY
ncbi:MAG: transglutaminase domain-containing protein [Hydrogeniiclostridium sp.]